MCLYSRVLLDSPAVTEVVPSLVDRLDSTAVAALVACLMQGRHASTLNLAQLPLTWGRGRGRARGQIKERVRGRGT